MDSSLAEFPIALGISLSLVAARVIRVAVDFDCVRFPTIENEEVDAIPDLSSPDDVGLRGDDEVGVSERSIDNFFRVSHAKCIHTLQRLPASGPPVGMKR